MKKIATITFHWCNNYGAVLQAYALQQFLLSNGFDTEIINYLPWKVRLLKNLETIQKKQFELKQRERSIKRFIKNELILSTKRYYTHKSLFACSNKYDTVICGSDQVWNQSFLLHSEFVTNLSYYLDFVNDETKKIAYAVSFGAEDFPGEVKEKIKPYANRMNFLGVREKSGQILLESIGVDSMLVLDPTLLINADTYKKLITKAKKSDEQKVFTYILHDNQTNAEKTCEYVCSRYNEKPFSKIQLNLGIYEWLEKINHSEFIVTNSYHGVIFSIIFQKPFIAVRVENSGMNGRIDTLLSNLGIENRIIEKFNPETVGKIMNQNIDWNKVDIRLENIKKNSVKFLYDALKAEV